MVGKNEHPNDFEHRFYWSFHELNNGSIISLQYIENLKNDEIIDADLDMSYANYELKNGGIIRHEFGQDFFNWFEALAPVKDLRKLTYPNEKEEECVKDFFYDRVYDSMSTPTGVVVI